MSERNNTARLITSNASENENKMTNTVCMPVAHHNPDYSDSVVFLQCQTFMVHCCFWGSALVSTLLGG